jgi:hypothetical protein
MDTIIYEHLSGVHHLSGKKSPENVIYVFSISVRRKYAENIEEAPMISGAGSGHRSASEWILAASAMSIDAAYQIWGP